MEEPVCKKRFLDTDRNDNINKDDSESLQQCVETVIKTLHSEIEESYSLKCLCGISGEKIQNYIQLNQTKLPLNLSDVNNYTAQDSCLLYLNFLAWVGQTYHDQLLGSEVCLRIYSTVQFLVNQPGRIENLLLLLKAPDQNVQYSVVQIVAALLPLCHCGADVTLPHSETVLKKLINDVIGNQKNSNNELLDSIAPGEEAGLDGFDFGVVDDEDLQGPARGEPKEDGLDQKGWLLSILSAFITHGGRPLGDSPSAKNSSCELIPLDEESLCQEMQVKCMVIRAMDPVWPRFTGVLIKSLSSSSNSLSREVFLTEGFKVWRSLISVRANLSFVESRVFTADLPSCLPLLRAETSSSVWRAVLETVSECLCYGTTLGLQSIPPQEPCNLAHAIIR